LEFARAMTPHSTIAGLPANGLIERQAWRALGFASVVAISLLVLIAPALWNGYPLLQYDTGGYLARWYEGYLVPSRSTVFGIYLHLGEGFHFWPIIAAQ
jgi:hypothetical protein